MAKKVIRAVALDALCILLLVIIGTRNHETDTGISGVLFVGAPFWIALGIAHGSQLLSRTTKAEANQYVVWGYTVIMGMVLRNYVFDRGTALAFVIVATIFLGVTMLGWRALLSRRQSA